MERLYRALVWLAGVTLIVGVVASYLYGSALFNNTQSGFSISGPDGQGMSIAAFFQLLATQWNSMALNLSNVLDGGVIVLAATLAWATGRRIWLSALIVVALLMVVWPAVTFVWQTHYLPVQYGMHGASAVQSTLEMMTFISLGVPLIPVSLALVFGLARRRPATYATDAALGIERSAL